MVMEPKEYAEVLEHPIHHLRIWLDAWGIMLGQSNGQVEISLKRGNENADLRWTKYDLPWEPTTFIFRGYNPHIGGVKPSFFMVLGSHGTSDIFHRFTVVTFPSETSIAASNPGCLSCSWSSVPCCSIGSRCFPGFCRSHRGKWCRYG